MTTRIAILTLTVAAAGAAALTLTLASPATLRSPVPWAPLAFSKSEVAGGGVYVAGRGRARLVLPAATDPAIGNSLDAAPLAEAAAWMAHYQRFWQNRLEALDKFVTDKRKRSSKRKTK